MRRAATIETAALSRQRRGVFQKRKAPRVAGLWKAGWGRVVGRSGLGLFLLLTLGGHGGFGGLAGLEALAVVLAVLFPGLDIDQAALREEVADGVGGLGADAEPVLDPLFVELDLLGGILLDGVEPAEVVGGELQTQLGEVLDLRFFPLEALPEDMFWWHRQHIEDYQAGLGGSGVSRQEVVSRPGAANRAELYAMRDQSCLTRREFYHWYYQSDGPSKRTRQVK